MLRLSPRTSSRMPNAFALLVSGLSLTIIFGSFDPAPAGEDLTSPIAPPPATLLVPLPQDTAASVAVADGAEPTTAATPSPAPPGVLMDHGDMLKFSLLLMQDGARYIENVAAYSAVFHKQERIQGDLGDVQTIEMKVRHQPVFSIYMKWKNGDAGRQLLYNEEYPDKKMVVKLGGFKGRLLPAIKLEPSSPEAMTQARYPVTEAGVHGMLKQLIHCRQHDIKSGQGVRCIRLPNTVSDERECYCFVYEYESPAFNATYRKSLLLLDARNHFPLRVINHTWTNEEGLTAAELDAQTLIEDYSFTRVDFGRELVVEDFSRDNPAYRM
jgi:hypothetical protein